MIDIFEQRNHVGGIWNYSSAKLSCRIPIPQTDPRFDVKFQQDTPSERNQVEGGGDRGQLPEFETPLYDNLEANIPKFLMAYSDTPFPPDTPLFPNHETVLQYLDDYAEDIKHLIRFNTQVLDVRLRNAGQDFQDQWDITAEDLRSRKITKSTYDAVIVANGHYTVPHVPVIRGVGRWNEASPGIISHSKAYRIPEVFKDKRVLVIGNSASGVDIAAQIGRVCKQPLLLSSRSDSQFKQGAAAWKEDVPEVVEFLDPQSQERAVRFADGKIETNIDAIIFATGYFYSFPFLSNLKQPIITDGLRTQDVYQHIFHIDHPSLVFPVLNLKVIPFPLAENQLAVVARVWSGRLNLPSKSKMREWEEQTIRCNGEGRKFHVLPFPLDATTLNNLYKWAASAKKLDELENGGCGKMGKFWNEREVWMRSKFPEIKRAYAERGEARLRITTVEELGFDYDRRRQEQDSQSQDEAKT